MLCLSLVTNIAVDGLRAHTQRTIGWWSCEAIARPLHVGYASCGRADVAPARPMGSHSSKVSQESNCKRSTHAVRGALPAAWRAFAAHPAGCAARGVRAPQVRALRPSAGTPPSGSHIQQEGVLQSQLCKDIFCSRVSLLVVLGSLQESMHAPRLCWFLAVLAGFHRGQPQLPLVHLRMQPVLCRHVRCMLCPGARHCAGREEKEPMSQRDEAVEAWHVHHGSF